LRDLEVSAKLHCAHTLYIVNHTDCGAYRGMKLASGKKELDQHKQDLFAAKERIQKEYPELEVKLFLAQLEPGTENNYKINEIN
jgi:hypothetical protein